MKLRSVIATTKSSLIALAAGAVLVTGLVAAGHGVHASLSADGTTPAVVVPVQAVPMDPTPWG